MANSATTVAGLTSLMISWLDDDQQTYFTPANTLMWINYAIREVQKQLVMAGQNYYVKPVESILVVGQQDYILPSDFLKENRIEIVLSGTGYNEVRQPLNCITLNEQDWSSNNLGTPCQYYIKKDRFTVMPTPDTALVIRMYYSPKIADVTLTTDIPDIPEEYMEYVALLAAFNGFIKDDRVPDNLSMKIKEYQEGFKSMKNERTQDGSRHIVMSQDYDCNGWF